MSEGRTGQRWVDLTTVGCLLAVTAMGGFFGGGMIAVFVGKVVGSVRGCRPAEGLPACDWHVYMLVGAGLGLVLLPTVTFVRLRRIAHREAAAARTPERG